MTVYAGETATKASAVPTTNEGAVGSVEPETLGETRCSFDAGTADLRWRIRQAAARERIRRASPLGLLWSIR
jgi:hypothetical protein